MNKHFYYFFLCLWLSVNAYHVITVNHNFKLAREELDYLHAQVAELKAKEKKLPPCTTENAVKWWTETTNMADARKKICGK